MFKARFWSVNVEFVNSVEKGTSMTGANRTGVWIRKQPTMS